MEKTIAELGLSESKSKRLGKTRLLNTPAQRQSIGAANAVRSNAGSSARLSKGEPAGELSNLARKLKKGGRATNREHHFLGALAGNLLKAFAPSIIEKVTSSFMPQQPQQRAKGGKVYKKKAPFLNEGSVTHIYGELNSTPKSHMRKNSGKRGR